MPYTDHDREQLIDYLEREVIFYSGPERYVKNSRGYRRKQEDDVQVAIAIVLAFCLDVRIGELRGLEWSNVDLTAGKIYIADQMVQVRDADWRKKDVLAGHLKSCYRPAREQPLSERATRVLRRFRQINPFGLLFHACDGSDKPLSTKTFNRWLDRYTERAGIQYHSSHKIRYWSISTMTNGGMSQKDRMDYSGHSTKEMDEHYSLKRIVGREDADELFKKLHN